MTEREDVVDWGVATGRYSPGRAKFWVRQADEEREKTGSTTETEATIRALAPVYDVSDYTWTRDPETGHAVLNTAPPASGSSDTPLLDDLDRQVFGPSTDERYRAQDYAAETELAAAIERERQTPGQLTEAEERAIFGDEGQA